MTTVERLRAVLAFQPVDRLPVVEWAPWWNQTLDRWRNEGLPEDVHIGTLLAGCEYWDMVRIGYVPLMGLLVAVVVILALHLLLTRTYFGKSVRATSENWKAAKLMGINVNRTYLITFSLGTAIAGLGGILVGMEWTLKALIVLVLAGIGSVGGAFIAGLILGVIEAVGAIFMGPYAVALGLVIFLAILMFRPQGLFGKA